MSKSSANIESLSIKCKCEAPMIHKRIREQTREWFLTDGQMAEIMENLLREIKRGLGKETHESAVIKCYCTYVQDLPNGTERGKFLALDLGGTNFRVLLIDLDGKKYSFEAKIYAIPQKIMVGTGEQLFDHIAECLAIFAKEHGVSNDVLPLGFTFSFPLKQVGLTKGILSTWTKGFKCSGVVGEDVVSKLKKAIEKRGDVKIDIMAILNDTTGTLMSCAWKVHNTMIGLIIGTGLNSCYVEKVENAELFDGDRSKPYVVINTEWGAFGADGCLADISNKFDKEVDENSINPGKQLYEKMVSGMYMGELTRLVLMRFAQDNYILREKRYDDLKKLAVRGNFPTKYVSQIESDARGDYTECRNVLRQLGILDVSVQDCENIRYICECVSTRAACLVSAGLATLINKMDKKMISVGIDGSVYRYHPHFHNRLVETMNRLVKPDIKFELMLSEDGSGRGAALVAAVAARNKT